MKPEAAEGPADETPADPIAPSDDATRLRWKPGQPSPRWWAFLGLLLLGAAGWWLFQGTARNPLDRLPDLPRNTTDQDVASFIEAARAVVTANPRDDDAWGQLGMAYAAHQMAAEAVTCWEIATELAPRKFAWRYLLGDAYVKFDQFDAIRQFE